MWNRTFLMVLVTAWLGLVSAGVAVPSQPTQSITVDQPLHFPEADGTALVVEPGVYEVSPLVGRRLRLQAGRNPPILLEADVSLHEEALELAEAALLPDEENPEVQHLVLLLPDGQLLEALGSTSGMSTRGFKKPWNQSEAIRQMMLARQQSPTGQPPQPPASPSQSTPSASPGAPVSPPPQASATQEGTGEFVGMVTWGFLRMHHPEMVLEELKQVQAGKQEVSTLNGLAGEQTLKRLLASDLSNVTLPSTQSTGVVSRGLFDGINRQIQEQMQAQAEALRNLPPAAPPAGAPLSGRVTKPAGGTVVQGTVLIDIGTSNNAAVQNVQILVDGSPAQCSLEKRAPYECKWNTQKVPNGAHTLSAVIRDTANKTVPVPPVTVRVNNAGGAPVGQSKPAPGVPGTPPPNVSFSPGQGPTRLGKDIISPSSPLLSTPPSPSPGPLGLPSKFQEKSLGAQYAKEAWTSILAGPGNISPERRAPLPVDYFPATLNLGHVWDKQIGRATLHLVAASEGTVTASMPEGTPFRVIEIQTYTGKIMPPSGNPNFQATRRVTHRPDYPETTLIAPPFRLPVKAGQDVAVTVEFAPKFNLLKEAAGEKRTTLHVEGLRWSADIPVTGFFEGLPLGVIATLDTYDVMFVEQPSYKACDLREGGDKNPAKVPVVATFINTDPETHVVAVRPERLDGKGRWNLQPFTIELKGNESRQVTMTLEGDRCKGLQSGMFDSKIRYHFYEGPSKPGGTRSLRFSLSVYPGILRWEHKGSVGSCDYTWHYTAHSDGYQYLYTQVWNRNLVWNMDFLVEIYLLNIKVAALISHPHRTEAGVVKSHGFNQSFIQNNWTALYGAKPGYKVGCTQR